MNDTIDIRISKLETDMQVTAEKISVLNSYHADFKSWLIQISEKLESIRDESHKTAIALTKLTQLDTLEKRLDSAEKKIERLAIWRWTLAGALMLLGFLIKTGYL